MAGFLAARAILAWFLALATMLVLGILANDHVVVLAIRADSPHPLSLLEVVGVLGASVVPALAAPRLRSWESGAARPVLHGLAALLAAALITLPSAIVGICALMHHLPQAARETAVSNTVLVAAVSGLFAACADPRIGPPAALAVFAGLTVVEAMWPQLAEPVSLGCASTVSTLTSTALSVASVVVSARWLGRWRRFSTPDTRARSGTPTG